MTFKAVKYHNNLERGFYAWFDKAYQYENLTIDLCGLTISQKKIIINLIKDYFTDIQKKNIVIYNGPYMNASALIKKDIQQS